MKIVGIDSYLIPMFDNPSWMPSCTVIFEEDNGRRHIKRLLKDGWRMYADIGSTRYYVHNVGHLYAPKMEICSSKSLKTEQSA